MDEADATLFPAPGIQRPAPTKSRSSRIRHRLQRRRQINVLANRYVGSLNGLHAGDMLQHTDNRRKIDPSSQLHAAWSQLHADAIGRAQQLMKARRGESMTGARALAALLKTHGSEV